MGKDAATRIVAVRGAAAGGTAVAADADAPADPYAAAMVTGVAGSAARRWPSLGL
jgi:hypothetical protein